MAGSARAERAWVRRAQAGSASDFEALFRAHLGPAYRAAYLVVRDAPAAEDIAQEGFTAALRAPAAAAAEDIAQEAFLAAGRALDRLDRRRPFGPWLHRIVVNRAIDWARRRRLRGEVELHEAPAEQGEADVGSDTVAALQRLSPEHRAVSVLRHLLGYTPGQIARLLDL